ncbi:hypothetical protein KO506_06780 [Polaribacter vadi]|uniref:hypothetical protein n=1 Tax=Polaribacter TaxID=52959 RepID=UPI001C0871B7|nr:MULTISPECIES: hypothetical protein [Polaribacter]MBU3011100.1 hypothetical protein [Polaribacter vadi]MDO6740914.1 hypothetical protein [Polaribacter sp. 1_MG-2023]
MSDKDDLNELEKMKKLMQEKLAEGISKLIRSIGSKEKRLAGLKSMKSKPSDENLKLVYKIAMEKEDYETCGTIKEYFDEKGIQL